MEGCSGEQFARPDALALLRKQKKEPRDLPPVVISATDPLNLVGILLPGERIPALHTNRILFKNGLPIAKQLNGVTTFLSETDPTTENLLTHRCLSYKGPAKSLEEMEAGVMAEARRRHEGN